MRLIARIRCWFKGHIDTKAFDAKARTIRLKCSECQRQTRGFVIDAKRPEPTRDVKKRKRVKPVSRIGWLRGVHQRGA
jgi:hypothetical protein